MIGDNIKNVRTTLNLTQQAFAKKINLKQGTISSVENNKCNISRQSILTICREFGVNENYLLKGEGEMFIERDDSSLGKLRKEYNLSAGDVVAIKSFLELPPEYRKGVIYWGKNFAKETAAQLGIDFPLMEKDLDNSPLTKREITTIIETEIEETRKAQKIP